MPAASQIVEDLAGNLFRITGAGLDHAWEGVALKRKRDGSLVEKFSGRVILVRKLGCKVVG